MLLDAGASVECRPQHLLQFARDGRVYARVALGVERPRVGLLSIGEEATKGNELTREAHRLLKAAPVNFIGNVEGREIYSGVADVIVCDGFTGNVVLKTSEGLVETVEALLGDELRGTFSSQVGYLLSRRAFRRFRRRRRLLGVRRRAAARRRRPGHRRPRPLVGQGGAQRDCDGVPIRDRATSSHRVEREIARALGARPDRLVIAFIFPGQGSQQVGMGKALAEAYPEARGSIRRGRCRIRASRRSEACALSDLRNGPERSATLTESRSPRSSRPASPPAACWRAQGITPSFVAGHSLGEYSAHVAAGTLRVRRRGAHSCAAAAATCRKPCRSATGAMAAILGLDPTVVAQACEEAAQGEVVSPANINAPGQIVDRRPRRPPCARAGSGPRRSARKRAIPLTVSAPFHCALMKPAEAAARAGAARARRRARRACRSSPTSMPSRSAMRAAAIDALVRQVSAPCAGRTSSSALRPKASPRMLRWARARCSAAWSRQIQQGRTRHGIRIARDLGAIVAACSISAEK